MNDPVLVRDVMNRTFVGVNEGDPIQGVAGLMRDEDVNSAVVLRGPSPVGIVTARDVVGLVADAGDPQGAIVEDLMRQPAVSIDAEDRLEDAVEMIAGRDVRRLIVTDGDEVVGVLSEHDLVAAHSVLPAVGDAGEAVTPGPGDAFESAAAEADRRIDQGVCEICGALARSLDEVNGQLVCADCREMEA